MKNLLILVVSILVVSSCATKNPEREPQQVAGDIGNKKFTHTSDLTAEGGGDYKRYMQAITYKDGNDIDTMIHGFVDNLQSRNCPKKLLDLTANKLAIAMGAKLIALNVKLNVDDGVPYFVIYPEFINNPTGRTHGQKCLINNYK